MKQAIATVLAATALSACATVETLIPGGDAPDATLTAIQGARVRTCPQGRTLENARIGSDNESRGVTSEDIALTPLASDPSRALRLRRITVAPGGIIAWHTHDEVQGSALLVSGRMTEFRNSCLDEIEYRAGDVAIEDARTAHGWRNESDDTPAVVIVAHVVAR
jgi:quercetin dioxygenase-like cupin family protein